MIDGFRTASYASRLKIPVIYGLDTVHGVGPGQGRHRLPAQHRARRHARSGAGRGGGARRRRGDGRRRRRLPVRAGGGGGARRALGADLRGVRRDASSWRRRWASPTQRLPEAQRRVHGARERQALPGRRRHRERRRQRADTSGDEAALRALHLAPYQAVVARRRRIDHGVVQQLAGDAHARQHGDDHRRAQGRARLRRLRRLRLQRLLPGRREHHDAWPAASTRASTCS